MSQNFRIFWLGAHKVLKKTELVQLRSMGYEVFNPAYISPVYDQSMDRTVDFDQPTSLPPEVFAELIAHDFFYTQVPEKISELLNAYFDVAIVTIKPDWLIALLRGFAGRVIWRVYGQPYLLSEHFVANDYWKDIMNRDNLAIVPFCAESIEPEHRWLVDLCKEIVPYQIPDDVFEFSRTWGSRPMRKEIAVSIPNIENPYYSAMYHNFTAQYPHRVFKIYGPQRSVPADSRIVGGLERADFLWRFAETAGYYYIYTDSVCYLPPIEMMEVGGRCCTRKARY